MQRSWRGIRRLRPCWPARARRGPGVPGRGRPQPAHRPIAPARRLPRCAAPRRHRAPPPWAARPAASAPPAKTPRGRTRGTWTGPRLARPLPRPCRRATRPRPIASPSARAARPALQPLRAASTPSAPALAHQPQLALLRHPGLQPAPAARRLRQAACMRPPPSPKPRPGRSVGPPPRPWPAPAPAAIPRPPPRIAADSLGRPPRPDVTARAPSVNGNGPMCLLRPSTGLERSQGPTRPPAPPR